MKKSTQFLLLSILLRTASIAAGADIPYLTGRVVDNAQILSPETRRLLTDSLKAHEDRTGNQIAVLTVPTLNGESIEEYAVEVFKEWKLGQKGKDNGILIIVVPPERRMRIEVGYGLEGTMTDGTAGQIIRNIMTPRFKDGDYNGGIIDGARAVMLVLEGRNLADTASADGGVPEKSKSMHIEGPDLPITERILFGAFIYGTIGLFTVMGILTPGIGWFLYFFLIPFWAMFPIVIIGTKGALYGLVAYLIVYPLAKVFIKNTDWYKKAKKDLVTKGSASLGGFTLRSGGSGGSWTSGSSGSSGGSSFSGGGGSSGGGGASGSW